MSMVNLMLGLEYLKWEVLDLLEIDRKLIS